MVMADVSKILWVVKAGQNSSFITTKLKSKAEELFQWFKGLNGIKGKLDSSSTALVCGPWI